MGNTTSLVEDDVFAGSTFIDSLNPCGSLNDTEQSPSHANKAPSSYIDEKLFDSEYEGFGRKVDEEREESNTILPSSQQGANRTSAALFAKALVNEVTNNPETMLPSAMAEREKRLMKAQERARNASKNGESTKAVGAPGGIGQPNVMGTIAHALTGRTDPLPNIGQTKASVFPPSSMRENRAAHADANAPEIANGVHTITLGLALSRRSSIGHRDTITRQTAFDFNELQDREYKFVSSTDASGWRAGGGELGNTPATPMGAANRQDQSTVCSASMGEGYKIAAPDTVHIPIIQIAAESPKVIDTIIAALSRGELFIPHMSVIPEALSVDGVSPPDLTVRFGTERNEDLPPDQWPNWCLEFMHNQLYEYFQDMGAQWTKRPFSITLAKKVRWKTVKHMNKYFAHAERVIDAWREKGPQYLDPQLAYIAGGSTPEEVARPHGIYLFRNGVPTNYFAPNFDPPYTTNMTRNLLLNVLNKSWDKKRREWTSQPIPRLVTPALIAAAMCGCSDSMSSGYMANEVTIINSNSMTPDLSALPDGSDIHSDHTRTMSEAMMETPRCQLETPQEEDEEQSSDDESDDVFFGPERPKTETVVPVSVEAAKEEGDCNESIQDEGADTEDEKLSETIDEAVKHQPKGEEPSFKNASDQLEPFITGAEEKKQNEPSFKNVSNELELFITSHKKEEDTDGDKIEDGQVAEQLTPLRQPSEQASHAATVEEEEAVEADGQQQLVSDEDWFDEMGEPIMSPAGAAVAPSLPTVPASTVEADQAIEEKNIEEEETAESEVFQPSDTSAEANPTTIPDVVQEEEPVPHEVSSHTINTVADPIISKVAKNDPDGETHPEQEASTHTINTTSNPMIPDVTTEGEEREDAPEIKKEINTEARRDPPSSFSNEEPENDQENSSYSFNRSPETFNPTPEKAVMDHSENKKSINASSEIHKTNSGLSLEYSIDSTHFGDKSAFTNQSSLMGQHFTQGKMPVTHESHDEELPHADSKEDSDSTDTESIPSDESLFNMGWAKALDPSSGSYYYFTLDRSKTTWDNPISSSIHTRPSMDTADSLGAI